MIRNSRNLECITTLLFPGEKEPIKVEYKGSSINLEVGESFDFKYPSDEIVRQDYPGVKEGRYEVKLIRKELVPENLSDDKFRISYILERTL